MQRDWASVYLSICPCYYCHLYAFTLGTNHNTPNARYGTAFVHRGIFSLKVDNTTAMTLRERYYCHLLSAKIIMAAIPKSTRR
jgi:hypothetical protein